MNHEVESYEGELKALRKSYEILRHIMSEKLEGVYFICGEKDSMNLPEDMVLVPREPTREMVAAGDFVLFEASLSDGTFGGDAIDTYRAMLSVAPKVTT